MREHMGLYRGKRLGNGEWVEGDLLHLPHGIAIMANGYALVDPDTVGECTGLPDKNGKLIFEGDIIKNIDGVSLVIFEETMKGFYMRFFDAPDDSPIDMGEMWDDTEIIGNIHDKPELLKKDGDADD